MSDAERWILIDGYKRVRALRRLGQDLVGATCWDLSEAEALVLDRLMRTGDGVTALEQGWLLHELYVRFEQSLEKLGRYEIPTGRQFFGSVIGDHVKTNIGCRLMPGTYVGFCCASGSTLCIRLYVSRRRYSSRPGLSYHQ